LKNNVAVKGEEQNGILSRNWGGKRRLVPRGEKYLEKMKIATGGVLFLLEGCFLIVGKLLRKFPGEKGKMGKLLRDQVN